MTISVRPRTKMLAALMAAGVVVAGTPAVTMAEHSALPALSTVAVQPASLITDALYSFGDAVYAGTWAIGIPVDAVISAPFDAIFSAAGALEDPQAIGSVLSFLAQRYLNPADDYPYYSYPWDFNANVLETLAGLLPYPLSQAAIDSLTAVADGIGNVLSVLPDPTTGADLFDYNRLDTFLGSALYATQLGLLAPVYALANTATWLGYEPAVVAETIEAAFQNPADIPGLVSNLVYGVLDPDDGLLGQVAWPFVNAASYAPPPLGWSDTNDGLALNAYGAFSAAVNAVLGAVLPTPIVPGQMVNLKTESTVTADTAAPEEDVTLAKAEAPATDATDVEKVAVSDNKPATSAAPADEATQDTTPPADDDTKSTPVHKKTGSKTKAAKDATSSAGTGRHAKPDNDGAKASSGADKSTGDKSTGDAAA
ncbi:hypothetical protein BH09ACT7_BH09ACT7_58430 [soil metagenome]